MLLVGWTVFVGVVLLWSLLHQKNGAMEMARMQGRSTFEKDLVYRRWAAGHGGVYVPVTEKTPPNPYLSHIKDRDITTPSGVALTLMNPAYMTRQVHELGAEQYGLKGHITSLNPIRPANLPDAWEKKTLETFSKDITEISSIEEMGGAAHMRVMRPLVTEKACLRCHAEQGYQEGDLRGGISVSVPMAPLWAIARRYTVMLVVGHGLLWLLGVGGIGVGAQRLRHRLSERRRTEEQIRDLARYPDENPNPVLRVGNDGGITYANEASRPLLEQWSCQVGQVISQHWRLIVQAALDSGQSQVTETICEDRAFSLSFAPLADSNYVNVYAFDITDRKDAEESLRTARDELEQRVEERTAELWRYVEALEQSESRLADAQRMAHLGNWDWDIINNTLWWSDEIYRIFGLKPQEFGATYEAFLSCVHPEDREYVEQSVSEALKKHRQYSIEHRIVHRNGTERIVHEQAEVTYDATGKAARMMGAVQDITGRKQVEEELLRYQRQLQAMASALTIAEEQQRRSIAEGLHDQVGQLLTAASMKLEYAEGLPSAPGGGADLAAIRALIQQAIKYTRTLTLELSPPRLYTLGFEAALKWLAEQMDEQYSIHCDFQDDQQPKPMADEVKVLLYRIVRELLHNVVKHAAARRTRICVCRVDENIEISVEDDGIGFDPGEVLSSTEGTGSFGMLNVRERLNYLKGNLEVRSAPGRGTRTIVTAPLTLSAECERKE